MSDAINVGKKASQVTVTDVRTPYTKVRIICDEIDESGTPTQIVHEYPEGETDGLTLEVNCPWGTAEMAENLYYSITEEENGVRVPTVRYTGYNVNDGLLNPVAEIGDGVTTNGVYGGLYSQNTFFGHTLYSDYSAPLDEQMNHEYAYESETERMIRRESSNTQALFRATNTKIEAKVSQEGGNNSSFGWSLLSDEFGLYANGKKVFRASVDGIEVYGKITATSGQIGATWNETSQTWKGGFFIKSKYITSNEAKTSYNSSTAGVFIGDTGIGLGAGAFTVSSSGAVVAKNIKVSSGITFIDSDGNTTTLSGSKITNGTITDGKISDVSGSKVGSGINGGNINNGSIEKGKTTSGVQSSLTRGDSAKTTLDNAINGNTPVNWYTNSLIVDGVFKKNDRNNYVQVSWIDVPGADGKTYRVLGRA